MTRRKFSRRRLITGSAALGFSLFASPLKAAAPEAVAITPELIEAAKQEGKVVLYSAMDLPVGEKLGNAFQAQYPGMEVQIERSGSERLFQRIAQEFSSNIRAADVISTADASHVISWKRNGWLAPFVPEDVAKYFPNEYRDADGMYVTSRIWLSSIACNTNLVKASEAPTSFADLLDPRWAGKMVKGHPAYSGTIMTTTFQIVRELGWDYLEKLSKQRVMQVQSSTDPPKKLALGERAIMADGNEYNVVLLKEAGQPVEPIYPASIEPGGYLFYDSTKPMPTSKFRDDITVIGVPLTAITNSTYTDPRQRQLFKNIIYLGAMCALLDMDPKLVEQLIGEQYKGKEKLLSSNVHALHLGRDWALQNLKCPIGLRVKKTDKVGDRIFLEGNSAAALGAVYGGATVCAWYPITPSSSLADAFTSHCKKLRHDPETGKAQYAIVQGEDELASIGIVIGASWNGARAFTATSGPGISLDDRIHRPLVLCRNPRRDHERAARRSLDRHADPHPAMRLEERFGDHREELGRVGGAVPIDQGGLVVVGLSHQRMKSCPSTRAHATYIDRARKGIGAPRRIRPPRSN